MHVAERLSLEEIQQLAKGQADARTRVQLQAIVLATQGRSAPDVARTLGQGRRTVQQWVHDYNRGGVEALHDRRGPGHARGNHRYLTPDQEQWVRQRLDDSGVIHADSHTTTTTTTTTSRSSTSTLRATDVKRIIEQHFGVVYQLGGIYALLHRLGYSWLMPRPRHPHADVVAQELFKKTPRAASTASRSNIPASGRASGSRTRPASVSRAR
jgi:transposase